MFTWFVWCVWLTDDFHFVNRSKSSCFSRHLTPASSPSSALCRDGSVHLSTVKITAITEKMYIEIKQSCCLKKVPLFSVWKRRKLFFYVMTTCQTGRWDQSLKEGASSDVNQGGGVSDVFLVKSEREGKQRERERKRKHSDKSFCVCV